MYWIELTGTDGIEVPLPSEEAYEASTDWYNDPENTKKKMIRYCAERRINLDDPVEDGMLVSYWADIAIATHSWQQHDPKMLEVIRLIVNEAQEDG
jgi:hypothetical protein